ncbi:MAG: sulfite exporter TauE/SafE family protein [Thermonemataceae bacterium]
MIPVAFVLGLLGSLHCLAMCGPLAMVVAAQTPRHAWTGRLLYNAGRITTYLGLGVLFGAFGKTLLLFISQQQLSFLLGIFLLLSALPFIHQYRIKRLRPLYHCTTWVKKHWIALLKNNQYITKFLLGSLNGLLPCGLVYTALVGALAQGAVWQGALFMLSFGIGTLPMLLGVMMMAGLQKIRLSVNRFLPWVSVMVALLFILRGLNLGIPYVSPTVPSNTTKVPVCQVNE